MTEVTASNIRIVAGRLHEQVCLWNSGRDPLPIQHTHFLGSRTRKDPSYAKLDYLQHLEDIPLCQEAYVRAVLDNIPNWLKAGTQREETYLSRYRKGLQYILAKTLDPAQGAAR